MKVTDFLADLIGQAETQDVLPTARTRRRTSADVAPEATATITPIASAVSITVPADFRLQDLPDDWREQYEERAAVMEFDGHVSRLCAESLALADTYQQWVTITSAAPRFG